MARGPRAPFELGGESVAPGERRRISLPGAKLYTDTPLDMPVEVIHGRRTGPVLLVCAAIHGDEINGVEIIRRLRAFKSLNRLHGTLVLVPVVNLFGFIHQSRYLPDRRDLNRVLPGLEKGSLGSRVAHTFFQEIVLRATHVVDLHTGAIHRDNLPQVRAALDNSDVKAMAMGFRIPVIVNAGLIEGSLRCEAGKVGIPVITYEAGEALRFDERAIVTGVRGIISVMRALDMLPTRRIRTVSAEPYIARSTKWYRAPIDGVFRPVANLGARVERGDLLGIVSSPFTSDELPITSTTEGIVVGANKLPLVNAGEALFHVARFSAASAVEDEIAAHGGDIENDPLYQVQTVDDPDLN